MHHISRHCETNTMTFSLLTLEVFCKILKINHENSEHQCVQCSMTINFSVVVDIKNFSSNRDLDSIVGHRHDLSFFFHFRCLKWSIWVFFNALSNFESQISSCNIIYELLESVYLVCHKLISQRNCTSFTSQYL